MKKLLIANRGEIAIRIARAAANLAIPTVAVHTPDDADSLHTRIADSAVALTGAGAAGYLDMDDVLRAAVDNNCDAIHPGYGFLSENAEFAEKVEQAGLKFVGPSAKLLALFGDKGTAREAAIAADVPVLNGTQGPTTLEEARAFMARLKSPAIIVKAIAGGGGRGTRIVRSPDDLDEAFERCRSEALAAFGNGDVYIEQLIERARHIEVQVVGDEHGAISHVGERECSVQRRHQKIIEIAPAIGLDDALRTAMIGAALRLARNVSYRSLGTFEFLLDADSHEYAFIEANARLQVEHTVTEEVSGIDLVETQIEIARGGHLDTLGIGNTPVIRGAAIQARVNLETIDTDGNVRPGAGTLSAYDPPTGPGVRVDGFGYTGYSTSTLYDSLLAKVIGHSSRGLADAAARVVRALSEFRVEGADTNIAFLQAVLKHQDFLSGQLTTRWVDEHAAELADVAPERRYVFSAAQDAGAGLAGAQIDNSDPLAVFDFDKQTQHQASTAVSNQPSLDGPGGTRGIPAPMQGTVVDVHVDVDQAVVAGTPLMIMEAMKMEHVIRADRSGIVRSIDARAGDVIVEGHPLLFIEESEVAGHAEQDDTGIDLDHIRDDLQENIDRHAFTLDENRAKAMKRREDSGQWSARQNIEALCDDGSFVEYGGLVLAAQRRRHSVDHLRENTPADGLVMGVGHVNGEWFDDTDSRCVVVAYDYTVLAGTQGMKNHYKQDRIFELAERYRLPVVLYSEGGGGRPGDTDSSGGIGMDVTTFTTWSRLSGLVPLVGVNSGYCFAGNTALLGCCDVIIATRDSTIAMGGPAMIEGGGLGIFAPREVGPMASQVPNGVVDILVEDDAEATRVAKQYLSYFQGPIDEWEAPDQRHMRHIVPENRKRMYDVRDVIETLADKNSILEIRKEFGIGIVTSFVRIEGRPMGLIANNPHHLAGAIDSDAADKAARFLQLCDAFDLPVISIMDCPGIMVGPEVERTALVRHCCRLFNTGANLSVPLFGLIIRKAYGLGVQAMCGGSSMVPFFCAAWPTAEFAGMNIEGSIKLAYRRDFEAMDNAEERIEKFNQMVERAYDQAKAVNAASFYGVDDVIDPAASRDWIVAGLSSLPPVATRTHKKRPYIDTW